MGAKQSFLYFAKNYAYPDRQTFVASIMSFSVILQSVDSVSVHLWQSVTDKNPHKTNGFPNDWIS